MILFHTGYKITTMAGARYDRLFNFIIVVLLILPIISLAISSFVIGNQNINTICSNSSFWSLQSWLLTSNSLQIIWYLGSLILLCILAQLFEGKINFDIYCTICVTLYTLMLIILNIMGCIIFFNKSNNCINQARPLWNVSLATLIFQWIYIIISAIITVFMFKSI